MSDDWKRQIDALHFELVRRDDPAAWVSGADALEASYLYRHLAVRGPVFGLAAREPGDETDWRLLNDVVDGAPRQARDGLNSLLGFKAKDSADGRAERRALLAAVARLEQERVNEVTVLGTRYRVVRGEEFARVGDDGLEPPRPTAPEPTVPSWEAVPALSRRGLRPRPGPRQRCHGGPRCGSRCAASATWATTSPRRSARTRAGPCGTTRTWCSRHRR